MTRDDEVTRGHQASEVLEHPMYIEAFEALRSETWREWERSTSAEERERLFLFHQALSRVRARLQTIMQTGQLALNPSEQSRYAAGQNFIGH